MFCSFRSWRHSGGNVIWSWRMLTVMLCLLGLQVENSSSNCSQMTYSWWLIETSYLKISSLKKNTKKSIQTLFLILTCNFFLVHKCCGKCLSPLAPKKNPQKQPFSVENRCYEFFSLCILFEVTLYTACCLTVFSIILASLSLESWCHYDTWLCSYECRIERTLVLYYTVTWTTMASFGTITEAKTPVSCKLCSGCTQSAPVKTWNFVEISLLILCKWWIFF